LDATTIPNSDLCTIVGSNVVVDHATSIGNHTFSGEMAGHLDLFNALDTDVKMLGVPCRNGDEALESI
jgi:hypothetical protein